MPLNIRSNHRELTGSFFLFLILPPTLWRFKGKGNNILVGTVTKAKVGYLEDELRELFTRRMKNEFTGVVVREGAGKKMFLVGFQHGLEK